MNHQSKEPHQATPDDQNDAESSKDEKTGSLSKPRGNKVSQVRPAGQHASLKPKRIHGPFDASRAHLNPDLQPYLRFLSLFKSSSWSTNKELDKQKFDLILKARKGRIFKSIILENSVVRGYLDLPLFLIGPSKIGFFKDHDHSVLTKKDRTIKLITFDYEAQESQEQVKELSVEVLPQSYRLKECIYLPVVDRILVTFDEPSSQYKLIDPKTGHFVNS